MSRGLIYALRSPSNPDPRLLLDQQRRANENFRDQPRPQPILSSPIRPIAPLMAQMMPPCNKWWRQYAGGDRQLIHAEHGQIDGVSGFTTTKSGELPAEAPRIPHTTVKATRSR